MQKVRYSAGHYFLSLYHHAFKNIRFSNGTLAISGIPFFNYKEMHKVRVEPLPSSQMQLSLNKGAVSNTEN